MASASALAWRTRTCPSASAGLDLADPLRLRLQLGRPDFLLLDLDVEDHALRLLLLREQGLEALRVLRGQDDVAQHDVLHHDAVFTELGRDDVGRALADLLPRGGEDLAHHVVRHDLAERAGHDHGHEVAVDVGRQVGVDVGEPLGVEAVADATARPTARPSLDWTESGSGAVFPTEVGQR
jgi:hypothetical protein